MESPSFPRPHSCQHCRNFVLSLLSNEKDEPQPETAIQCSIKWMKSVVEPRNAHLGLLDASTVIFEFSLKEAILAAAQGCSLCYWILCEGKDEISFQKAWFYNLAAKLTGGFIYFGVVERGQRGKSAVEVGEEEFTRMTPTLQLLANTNNPAAGHIPTRPINTTPSSPQSFALARRWLAICLETHQQCPKPASYMPKKVIEISSRGGKRLIRLRETSSFKGPAEPYAALSYCWGGEQDVKTTSATLASYFLEIKFEDLRATVRDAIVVAEELNIRFLWIDSLCIIQDDEEDKTSEIASMPRIYSQATITITASRACSVQEGFLHKRPMMGLDEPDAIFELPFRDLNGSSDLGPVVLLPPTNETIEPLDLRGWAMQERFLSRRIIEYGTHHTRWSCQEYMNCNAPTDGFKSTRVYNPLRSDYLFIRGLEIVMTEANSSGALDSDKRDQYLRIWHHLLRVYTTRFLSLPVDRLRAISGVAALFQSVLRDTYWAGLWKSKIAKELLWMRSSINRSKLKSRPTEYQGPSWSWAAIDAPFQETFPWNDEVSHKDFRVLDCDVRPHGKASHHVNGHFGAVLSAKLIIRGRIQTAVLAAASSSPETGESVELQFPSLPNGRPEGVRSLSVTIDCKEEELATSLGCIEVSLLTIIVSGDYSAGLVLRRHSLGEYSRLGIYRCGSRLRESPVWLDQGVEQTITLI